MSNGGHHKKLNRLTCTLTCTCTCTYACTCLPHLQVSMHLDVPEFVGVERSNCPSWLLVAAHCSGLFRDYRWS